MTDDVTAHSLSLPPKCRDALTTRQKLISQDYRVSYSLAKACKLDLRKQRCSVDTSLPRAREARLSYLLLCLEAAVHRGEWRGLSSEPARDSRANVWSCAAQGVRSAASVRARCWTTGGC